MCPPQAVPNADEVTRCPEVGTTDTDLGTTDARFGADALGVKLDGFRSKAHNKACTSCMRDSRDTQLFCDWSYPCHSTESSRTFLCVRALHLRLIS